MRFISPLGFQVEGVQSPEELLKIHPLQNAKGVTSPRIQMLTEIVREQKEALRSLVRRSVVVW